MPGTEFILQKMTFVYLLHPVQSPTLFNLHPYTSVLDSVHKSQILLKVARVKGWKLNYFFSGPTWGNPIYSLRHITICGSKHIPQWFYNYLFRLYQMWNQCNERKNNNYKKIKNERKKNKQKTHTHKIATTTTTKKTQRDKDDTCIHTRTHNRIFLRNSFKSINII
jgi:hypothetical protein